MILILSNGRQLRGDIIKSAVMRSDLAPVPATLEAEIRVDDELKSLLAEGKTITARGDLFRIVKSEGGSGRESQGIHDTSAIKITGLLDACHKIAFVRDRAIIETNTKFAEIYRAAGATLRAIEADGTVPRFSCFVGQVPSYHIARALQEEGGVMRWKSGKMTFFKLADLFNQKPVMTLPDIASEDIASGFLERHEVPFFYSLRDDGSIVHGDRGKSRTARFSPFKNALRLRNMTRYLVTKKISKVYHAGQLCAGDLINIAGADPLVVVTAAHAFFSGTDGSENHQYSRLWLASLGD